MNEKGNRWTWSERDGHVAELELNGVQFLKPWTWTERSSQI